MSEVKISRSEAALIDKALRALRDRHYRREGEVSPEAFARNREVFDKCDELRHRILREAN